MTHIVDYKNLYKTLIDNAYKSDLKFNNCVFVCVYMVFLFINLLGILRSSLKF